jgi:hypothetical protein
MTTTAAAGAAKKEAASSILKSELPNLQEILQAFGPNAHIDEAKLGGVIDASAALYNAVHELVTAIHPTQAAPGPIPAPSPALAAALQSK